MGFFLCVETRHFASFFFLAMREAPLANLSGLPKVEALFAPIIFIEK